MLNNFVTELLNVLLPVNKLSAEYSFIHIRDGWIFVRIASKFGKNGQIKVRIDGNEVAMQEYAELQLLEGFHWLQAGKHEIQVKCEGDLRAERIIVRSIPEILFAKYGYNPWVSNFGPYDWIFLKKHILPNITTIIGTGRQEDTELAREWKASGRKWIVECGVPALGERGEKPTITVDEAFTYWAKNPGFQGKFLDGVIADEFLDERANYPVWTAAIERLSQDFKGRVFYPYLGTSGKWFYTSEHGKRFVDTVIKANFKLVWERYLREQPTEEKARDFIKQNLKDAVDSWTKHAPNFINHLIVCLGVFSCFPLTLNHDPNVDFKVYLDMQMHHIATDPTFAKIYGIMGWTSGYMDEETVRWLGALYRHYCIEGEKSPLSEKYKLQYCTNHLYNPDFEQGLEGWSIKPAEESSIEVRKMDGYGWIQGRWPRTSKGDTFLWMKRSAKRPNIVSQTIKNLEPGRLYSLKFVTADLQGLLEKKTQKELHAISVYVEDAKVISGFDTVIPSRTVQGHWLNFHWRVFLAKSNWANLIISDWESEKEPKGKFGQELALNFVEIQPYWQQ